MGYRYTVKYVSIKIWFTCTLQHIPVYRTVRIPLYYVVVVTVVVKSSDIKFHTPIPTGYTTYVL